jgi:D-amino-acid oxidase
MSPNTIANIYLAKENGELVICEGSNPNAGKYADKHILIVGGGVTGLTVSTF